MAYDRKKAVSYAYFNWHKVCHDLYIATKAGAPGTKPGMPYVKVDPATRFYGNPEQARTPDAIVLGYSDLEDCTHFISCCLGPMGGGLQIGSDFPLGPYGRLAPQRLLDSLTQTGRATVLGKEKTKAWTIPDGLQEGDLIAYSNGGGYAHCAMYLGNGTITCHTTCRWLAPWDLGFSKVTFIHVK